MATDAATLERLALMERRATARADAGHHCDSLGMWLWMGYGFSGGWLHAKTTLVTFLIGYHLYCGRLVREFAAGRNTRSHVSYRSSMKCRCWCCSRWSSWWCSSPSERVRGRAQRLPDGCVVRMFF